ncbi:MAG TPA: PQQ-binding-like beta-propeller repeat protein [Pirellulales bacterium]|jgi:outer membrane protein assembly factor BamB
MRVLVLLIAGLCGIASPVAAEVNWPQFRGPGGDGISAETGLSLAWSESEHVAWKTAIHDRGWSSPVIWDRQIWMTTATVDGKRLFAVCIDRVSGRVVHDILVFEIAEPQFCHALNSYASPTPVVEEGRVYVHFGSAGTACLDTESGQILWTRQDLPCNHWRGAGSSPILFGDLLVVAYDGYDLQYVVALDKSTGKTVWRRDRNIDYGHDDGDQKKAYCTATVIRIDGKPQLVYPSAGATIAYEPETGDELWRVQHGGMNAASRPLFGNGRLYLNSADGGFKLFALRTGGTGDVTQTHVEWKCKDGVPSRSSQLLVGNQIFMVSDRGVTTSLNAETGKPLWQSRLGGDFSASPICADGRVYFPNQDGRTFVVEAGPEFKLLATNTLDDGCMASPAVYGKSLFLRTETHLYRIED